MLVFSWLVRHLWLHGGCGSTLVAEEGYIFVHMYVYIDNGMIAWW